jgi:hypothetical protein
MRVVLLSAWRLGHWRHRSLSGPAVLTGISMHVNISIMTRRITANLPETLLADAMKVTKKGITETIVEALQMVRRSNACESAMALKGKIRLDVDLEESRERRRR